MSICGDKAGTDAGYQRHRKVKGIPCALCKVANQKRLDTWKAANPERYRRAHRNSVLKRNYGITLDDYEALHEAQNGLCAICSRPETTANRTLAVDHCHDTGKVRGLLCTNCNVSLGKMNDDPALLRRAATYLEGQ